MPDPDVKIRVSAVDQASGVFDRAARALKNMKRESRMAGENALSQALGSKEGAAGAIADYLGLGIHAIVLSQLGEAFKNITAEMVALKEKSAGSAISIKEMVRGIAEGVPLLGSFVRGFANLDEFITGAKAHSKELFDEWQRRENSREAMRKSGVDAKRALRLAGEDTKERLFAAEDEATGDTFFASSMAAARKYNKTVTDLKKRRDESPFESVKEAFDKQIELERQAFEAEGRNALHEHWKKLGEARKKQFDEQIKGEEAGRKFMFDQVANSVMGPTPAPPKPGPDLTAAYQRETITPDLIMGQGSGAAARQREESAAKDDAGKRTVKELEKLNTAVLNLTTAILNPPMGPPALSAAF